MTIPHFGYDYVIYSLCKKLGIKTLILQRIPVVRGMEPHLYVFENINEHIKDLKDKFNFYATNNDKIELNKDFKCYLELRKNKNKTFTGVRNFTGFTGKIRKILFPITSRLSGASKLRKYVIWQDFFL